MKAAAATVIPAKFIAKIAFKTKKPLPKNFHVELIANTTPRFRGSVYQGWIGKDCANHLVCNDTNEAIKALKGTVLGTIQAMSIEGPHPIHPKDHSLAALPALNAIHPNEVTLENNIRVWDEKEKDLQHICSTESAAFHRPQLFTDKQSCIYVNKMLHISIPLKSNKEDANFHATPYHSCPENRKVIDDVVDALKNQGKLSDTTGVSFIAVPCFVKWRISHDHHGNLVREGRPVLDVREINA